jgi:nucleotide-binding universal stress UspA family protein
MMYQRILVPIDNSEYSNEAVVTAANLAERCGATVVAFHAYAGSLHENRFRQMEPGLPERYQEPAELDHQRSVHNTLISEGLQIISESYLDHAQDIIREREVPFERQLVEGRNYVEILREIDRDGYDLVAMGSLGLGASQRSLIGGVSDRVLRRSPIDVLLVRKEPPDSHGIMVTVDGSPNSFEAVDTALRWGRASEQPVEIVSVFDPEFHIVAFRSITNVLSEEGAKMFRFEEQQRLHEEIIDKGLEKLYQGHLDTAERMAASASQPVKTTLLSGKPFQQILDYVEECRPSLLVTGRFGLHKTDYSDMGNTSDNLARLATCSVLVVSGELVPDQVDASEQESVLEVVWTDEAEERFQSVPPFAQAMARKAIEGYAREHGYDKITTDVMTEARGKMGM